MRLHRLTLCCKGEREGHGRKPRNNTCPSAPLRRTKFNSGAHPCTLLQWLVRKRPPFPPKGSLFFFWGGSGLAILPLGTQRDRFSRTFPSGGEHQRGEGRAGRREGGVFPRCYNQSALFAQPWRPWQPSKANVSLVNNRPV